MTLERHAEVPVMDGDRHGFVCPRCDGLLVLDGAQYEQQGYTRRYACACLGGAWYQVRTYDLLLWLWEAK